MKRNTIGGGILLVMTASLAGCIAVGTGIPPNTAGPVNIMPPPLDTSVPYPGVTMVPNPIATSMPYPVETIVPNPSVALLPYPISTLPLPTLAAPVTETAIVPTSVPALLSLAVFPKGADPLFSLAWPVLSGCAQNITLVPYRISLDHQGLAAIQQSKGEYSLFWDWQQEANEPSQWKEIRPLDNNPRLQNQITFLALDYDEQWWVVYVGGFCQRPVVWGRVPVSNPQHVYFVATNRTRDDAPWVYWVIDNDVLHIYHWINGEVTEKGSLQAISADGVSPFSFDVTGDGEPEWILQWWKRGNDSDQRGTPISFQVLQSKNNHYSLIGEVSPGCQMLDVDVDGALEFSQPRPETRADYWDIYKWNGNNFQWSEVLTRPMVVAAQKIDPNLQTLPPLSQDIYFSLDQGGGNWKWPRIGGVIQRAGEFPDEPTRQPGCTPPQVPHRVFSWSPKCHFALVDIPHYEGGSSGLLNVATGQVMEIPGSFVYASGYSTFAWDPAEHFVIHASADGVDGLYKISLPEEKIETLVSLSGTRLDNWLGGRGRGAVNPIVLDDDSILFTVQDIESSNLYPPLGVYKLTTDYRLELLAEIPPLTKPEFSDGPIGYGGVRLSPDETMFMYYAPINRSQNVLLLGMMDGSMVWDLTNTVLGTTVDFRWHK